MARDLPHGRQGPSRFRVGAVQQSSRAGSSSYSIEGLQCDKGERLNLGISHEIAEVVATPQQVGVSKLLWNNMFSSAGNLFNRAPHFTPYGKTSYAMIHYQQVDIFMLRAVGVRALLHNKMKFNELSWEGKHCAYAGDCQLYRISSSPIHNMAEIRILRFLKTPDMQPLVEEKEDIHYTRRTFLRVRLSKITNRVVQSISRKLVI